ncbi:disease resistance protein Pik-2-like, partial [Miscanthus floridulus]|uniref:disease resistance protein Pik-2-like n=1 Tax=Miscanthus floridulus TaxID=154761 RepID=UPI003458234A
YLMVIDDIWDRSSWDTIKYGLINNDKGSGVITTSRIFEVAENSGEVCQLKPLSCDHSKELFYARLGSKGAYISDQLDDKSTKYILEKCGGLPLAIITIASLLAGKSAEEWSEVYSRIGFGQEGTRAQNTKKILLFSYNDLPTHLKTCFLYLSIFPEDHMIEKNALVWKWIAEGFVHEEKGQTLFEVGERYFNELINRSMMQPVEAIGPWYEHIFETYDIWACRVHDMVHDLICSMAKEENFVTIVDRNEKHLSSQNKARIVAVQNRVLDQYDLAKTCKQEVMRSFNATKCDISREALDSLLTRFRVLQVLSLEGSLTIISRWTPVDVYGLKNLARLHHLRYLGLSRTAINEQPMELGDLRFLQFLDLRETGIKAVPQSVTLLRELKCLRCGTFDAPVTLPDGMGSLTSLEELRLQVASSRPGYSYLLRTKGVDQKHPLADFSTELGKLTALRVLHVKISEFPDKLEELALVESLNKLKKLVELEVVYRSNDNLDICHGYLPCPRLRRLCLGHEIELPVWISTSSLRNLSYLSLSLTSMKPGDLNNIGSLPELRSFLVSCDLDFCDVIAAGAFPKLRFWANNSMIAYQQGAMSCLEFLQLDFHAKAYIGFDFGSLQYLPALEKVFAQIYCGDVKRKEGEAVKAALRHSIDNHPTADLIKFGRYTDIKVFDHVRETESAHDVWMALQALHGDTSPHLMMASLRKRITRRRWRLRLLSPTMTW